MQRLISRVCRLHHRTGVLVRFTLKWKESANLVKDFFFLNRNKNASSFILRTRKNVEFLNDLGHFFTCVFRFQEEKTMLEKSLAQKYEISLAELKKKHQTERERDRATLLNAHSQELDALSAKHNAQVDSLSASLRAELAAMAVKLKSQHNAEVVALEAASESKRKADLESLEELEKRMLGNMDTLEARYLKEVQVSNFLE